MLYESIFVAPGEERPERTILSKPSIAKYLEEWGKPGDIGIIACDPKGRPMGSITCRFFDADCPGYGYVDEQTPELGMAVLEPNRGQGIGSALLRELLKTAKSKGIKRVSLSVDPQNPAVKLYQRFGFKQIGASGTSTTMCCSLTNDGEDGECE